MSHLLHYTSNHKYIIYPNDQYLHQPLAVIDRLPGKRVGIYHSINTAAVHAFESRCGIADSI